MLLDGKVAIVTGASRGIGRACATALAREGARVVLNFCGTADAEASGPEAIGDALAEITREGGEACACEGDVADAATAEHLVASAVEHFGGVDILVNNAGICPFHDFLDMPIELLERVTRVNYIGTFLCSQAAARQMIAQKRGGSIIAVSSISALVGGAQQAHYTPTKAAGHSLMQSIAIVLGPHGIRCNSVMPGTVLTDINRQDLAQPGKFEHVENRVPLGRLGKPGDIAEVVTFLASDMARYVNGAGILVDGGMFVNLQ